VLRCVGFSVVGAGKASCLSDLISLFAFFGDPFKEILLLQVLDKFCENVSELAEFVGIFAAWGHE